MAIWQYTFHVLPMESVEALSSDYQFEKTKDGFDDEPYWKFNPVNRDFFESVQNVLPKSKSWSNEIDLYGDQESNCFEVFFQEENEVISVSFRIDFRENYKEVLSYIIEFCFCNELVLLDEDLTIVFWNYKQVQNIIRNSSQVKKYNKLSEYKSS